MAIRQFMKSHALVIRIGIGAIVFGLAAFVLSRNWATVTHSVALARGASIGWLALGLALFCLTFMLAAAIYGVLAFKPLVYRQTLLVEIAAAFVNRILPSGIGGLGLHGVYLFKKRHSAADATVIVSINNGLGFVGHFALLLVVVLVQPAALKSIFADQHLSVPLPIAVVVAIAFTIVMILPATRQRLGRFAATMAVSLRKLQRKRLVVAVLLAMTLTAMYTCILYCVARSVGIQLNVAEVFIAFSVAMFASTATPTPGGLVGAEAGLVAGMVLYDVPLATAGAIALLYRLITYWLPIVPGATALWLLRKRKLM